MNCELKVQGKDYTYQILDTNLLQKLPGCVFNFYIYLSVIVTENSRGKITNKYMEKLKTPTGNFFFSGQNRDKAYYCEFQRYFKDILVA